jgi:hypothetical protein
VSRDDRRRLKRVAAKALRRAVRTGNGVKHQVPGSVTLSGGPMDGWVVKPDAPARQLGSRGQVLLRECAGHAETPDELVYTRIDIGWPHAVAMRR